MSAIIQKPYSAPALISHQAASVRRSPATYSVGICPTCGSDQTQRCEVVHAQGTTRSKSQGISVGFPFSFLNYSEANQTSELASRAQPPKPRGNWLVLLVAVVLYPICFLALGAGFVVIYESMGRLEEGPLLAILAIAVIGALVIVPGIISAVVSEIIRDRFFGRRNRAERNHWRARWLCHRCGCSWHQH